MPVTTVSAAVHITPGKPGFEPRSKLEPNKPSWLKIILVVVKTFFKHYKTKGQKLAHGDAGEAATDDIFFDE